MIKNFNLVWSLCFVALLGLAPLASFAQDEPGRKEVEDHLQSELSKVDDLFFKTSETSTGNKMWIVMWEEGGETSKIVIELRSLGKYGGKPLFGILAYSAVYSSDSPVPPAVIKAIATKNERTGLGHYSSDDAFQTIYINSTAPADNLTAGQLWITLAYISQNRIEFKTEIEQMLSNSK